jgi:hypothetical protein
VNTLRVALKRSGITLVETGRRNVDTVRLIAAALPRGLGEAP